MKLFAGVQTTDYQDILRAVGAYPDEQELRDIRLWEHEDGIIIQGRPSKEGEMGSFESYLLTDEDLKEMLENAYNRRHSKERPLQRLG